MKTYYRVLPFVVIINFLCLSLFAQDKIPPYFKVGSTDATLAKTTDAVVAALENNGFEVIGSYNPEGKDGFKVIAYTNTKLQNIVLNAKDRGIMAGILKIGIREKDDLTIISMLNPTYLFYAYLGDDADKYLKELEAVSKDAKNAMKSFGSELTGFGGEEKPDDLKDYHYMAFMPYFDDPVELNKFSSFEEGLKIIRKNLEMKKGNTLKVYELVREDKKMAVFGVGLLDKEEGEAHFLPIIGEDNIAAMPYEIVLMDNEASMLHGKYRFALHWPELSMSQFMKIMSTPGDVEKFLEALTQ
ncbi:MAG: hypothetical protein K9G76_00680 [Bacteroidales bacterium]|nr:hypothetical protein [Bacteroidales bacterium]MCF8402628.1 hypothetical protein [Bacteroidales bacterium]